MANVVLKPRSDEAKTSVAAEKVRGLTVEDMRGTLNAYYNTKGIAPLQKGIGDGETKERYASLKGKYENAWGQPLSDQDFYGILVRESKFIYAPFAKIRLFFAEMAGHGAVVQDAAVRVEQEMREAKMLLEEAGSKETPESMNAALTLARCGVFSVASPYVFSSAGCAAMLENPQEYARRYKLLKEGTTADVYANATALPRAMMNVENALANFKTLKDEGYVERISRDTETWVGVHIARPPAEFRKALDGSGREAFQQVDETQTYKKLRDARMMSYFHGYMNNLSGEAYVPDEKLVAYYKGVPLSHIRGIIGDGEVRGRYDGAIWCARDIRLAEAYIAGFATGSIGMEWSKAYSAGCGVVVEFRKDALQSEFKIGYGQTGGYEQVNEADIKTPGKAPVIPFTKEYVSRVLVYENSVYEELAGKLAGTGIDVVMMSDKVAAEYVQRDAYLQLGSSPEESAHLAKARELTYKEDYAGAIKAGDLALQANPKSAEAHLGKADAMSHMERNEEAVGECHAALGLDPLNARAYNVLWAVLNKLKTYNENTVLMERLDDSLRKRAHGGRLGESMPEFMVWDAVRCITKAGSVEDAIATDSQNYVRDGLNRFGQINDPNLLKELDGLLMKMRNENAGKEDVLAAIDIVEQLGRTFREGNLEELKMFDEKRFGGKAYEAAKLLETGDLDGLKRMFPNDDPQKLIAFWKQNRECDGVARAVEYLHVYPLRET